MTTFSGDSMKNLVLILPVVALLGACNSQPTVKAENASVADVTAATNNAVKLQPGKWQTVVKILSIDAPGLPAQMAGPMKQQMSAMGAQTVETCVTPEMAAKPPENMFGGAQNCTYEKFEMTGGKIDATLVCKGGAGGAPGDLRSTMSGTISGTAYDVTSEASMSMPAMPGAPAGGKVNTKTQVVGKRIGDCDAPKAG